MKIKALLLCIILTGTFGSCKKWIDVKPTDRLSEGPLFETREGFLKALNGVYIEMSNTSLYGQTLSASVIDVMAQYYFMNLSTSTFYDFTMFNYTRATPKATFDATWKKAYQIIVNCNVIIEEAGDANPVLPAPFHGIVKGEALALRAMLHFDMLRLFGPVWSEENKSKPAIPYTANSSIEITPLLTSETVMENILADLTLAKDLLENTDPIITEGVRHFDNNLGRNDFHFRQYRLNYYAVNALMARAYLWKGDKVNAYRTSKEIIDQVQKPDNPIFPFVTAAAATHSSKPDRVFSTEVMFSIYTVNRNVMYSNLFAPELQTIRRLSFSGGNNDRTRVNDIYDDANDFRMRIWEPVVVGSTTILTNQKYKDHVDAPGRYMIPLIRLSELYLIAAETSTNLTEATEFLNTVRTSRNSFSISPADHDELLLAVEKEFRKEMIGEGQMFYFFKRNNKQYIPNHAALTGIKSMVLENYQVPLPESETSLRN